MIKNIRMEKINLKNLHKVFILLKRKISNVIYSFILTFKYRCSHPPQPHFLSIVAIIKNEAPYIAEWIEYHLLVGVEKFYLYDNESADNLKEILEPYIRDGIVEYKYFPGKGKQILAYNDVLEKARKETHWLAVIDIDEFIVPISTATIPEFLKDFEMFPGIEINWIMYASSGQKDKKQGLVIERFKDHSSIEFAPNRYVKTILNPRLTTHIMVHDSESILWKNNVNANKEKAKPFCYYREGVFDKIRINHYFTKSFEEYIFKRNRGRGTNYKEKRSITDFYDYDRNDVIKNDNIMDKYIPMILSNIERKHKIKL